MEYKEWEELQDLFNSVDVPEPTYFYGFLMTGGNMKKEEIVEVFKTEGLDIAEDMAVAACKSVFNLIRLFVPKVSFGLGAIIGPIVDLVEPQILAMIDKIDGEDDPGY